MDYLLKSSVCMIAFYGLYFFGFRQLSFHSLNRFYLLASLAFSLTIPLINYEHEEVVFIDSTPIQELTSSEENLLQNIENQSIEEHIPVTETQQKPIDWLSVLSYIYFCGMAIMLLVLLKNIFVIVRILVKNRTENTNIFYTNSRFANASFFNYIFLNPDNLNPHEQSLIIAHEHLHGKQLHSLDMLFLSILKAIFWFNPVIYFYQKSLKQIHEYEVDTLMSATHDSRDYAHLLLKLGVAPNAMIINQFSTKPLSDRIQFLFKTPTKNMKKLLYFLAIPIIGVGVMAFAEEKVKVVYQEKTTEKIIKSIEVKAYPLVIKDARNYATWTSGISDFDFSPENISLNRIITKNYNGFHYSVNPNSLTINMIGEINEFIGKRFLALVITEKEVDSNGNLTKLGLAVKHLRTNEITKAEVFDMSDLREKGKNGAFIFIEGYDKNFKESQMSINYGTKNLAITKSSLPFKNLHSFVSYNVNTEGTSAIKHSSDIISYRVFPGRITQQTLQEAQAYFAKNGFDLKVNSFKNGKNNQYESIDLSFGKVSKVFIINDLKHLTKLKSEKNGKFYRQDESIVLEADIKTLETKIFVENRMFKMTEKSGNWEIKDVVMNEIYYQIDSTKFNYYLGVTSTKKGRIDSFKVIVNNKLLTEGKDYIIKNNTIYLDQKYGREKISFRIYSASIGNMLYPELAKLEAIPLVKSLFSVKMPSFLASNENKVSSKTIRIPFPDARPIKSQDTLRTILETNQLGKNPLVFINGEEYPSSILFRINPDIVTSTMIGSPENKKIIEVYGEKALNGVVKISTKKDAELLLDEQNYKYVIENIKRQLIPSQVRVKRVLLKDFNGKITEKVSVIDTRTGIDKISMRTEVGKKAVFFIDDVLVSEEEVNNYKGELFYNGYTNKIIEEKYPQEIKKADMVFNLKTKLK